MIGKTSVYLVSSRHRTVKRVHTHNSDGEGEDCLQIRQDVDVCVLNLNVDERLLRVNVDLLHALVGSHVCASVGVDVGAMKLPNTQQQNVALVPAQAGESSRCLRIETRSGNIRQRGCCTRTTASSFDPSLPLRDRLQHTPCRHTRCCTRIGRGSSASQRREGGCRCACRSSSHRWCPGRCERFGRHHGTTIRGRV